MTDSPSLLHLFCPDCPRTEYLCGTERHEGAVVPAKDVPAHADQDAMNRCVVCFGMGKRAVRCPRCKRRLRIDRRVRRSSPSNDGRNS